MFYQIEQSRYVEECDGSEIYAAIQRNAYFAHPENLLLCMVVDSRRHIRELAIRRILKARNSKKHNHVRIFKIPEINFDCSDYSEMIDWQNVEVTEPPALSKYTDETLKEFIESGETPDIPQFPCHTQAVERHIKLVQKLRCQYVAK